MIDLGVHEMPCNVSSREVSRNDLTPLNEALARNDYSTVIKSSKLFWQAFCQTVIENRPKANRLFSITIKGHDLVENYNTQYVVHVRLKKNIEIIRGILVEGFENGQPIDLLRRKFGDNIHLVKKSDVVNQTGWISIGDRTAFHKWSYKKYLDRYIEKLCTKIGATCQRILVDQRFIWENHDRDYKIDRIKKTKGYHIQWPDCPECIYPIPKKTIKSQHNDKLLCKMYEEQQLLNFSLVSNKTSESGEVKVDSVTLFAYGGDILQAILTADDTESKKESIVFDKYSVKTLKVFADYLYYGGEIFDPEAFEKRDVDIWELLDFACFHKLDDLVDGCTNIISLRVTKDDYQLVLDKAKLYKNDHLDNLSRHLLLKKHPNLIGNIFRIIDDLD